MNVEQRRNNNCLNTHQDPILSNHSCKESTHVYPIDTEMTSSSEEIKLNPDDLSMLRMQFAEQLAIERHLHKESEEEIRKVIEERESLLKSVVSLKKKNEKVVASWKLVILDDVVDLKKE